MSKKYFWLKLKEDFFRQKEIKKLRKIAGGDTYVLILLKIQLLSIKNEGKIFYEGIEDTIEQELALELDEDVENVRMTLFYCFKHFLIEKTTEDELILTSVLSNIGSESSVAERVRKHRQNKEALQCNTNVTECNAIETKCNTEIEIEIEKDIDINNININRFIDTVGENKEEKENIEKQVLKNAEMINNACSSEKNNDDVVVDLLKTKKEKQIVEDLNNLLKSSQMAELDVNKKSINLIQKLTYLTSSELTALVKKLKIANLSIAYLVSNPGNVNKLLSEKNQFTETRREFRNKNPVEVSGSYEIYVPPEEKKVYSEDTFNKDCKMTEHILKARKEGKTVEEIFKLFKQLQENNSNENLFEGYKPSYPKGG